MSDPAATPTNPTPANSNTPAPLSVRVPRIAAPVTEEEFRFAVAHLNQLRAECDRTILEKDTEPKICRSLHELSFILVAHAEEFLQCWAMVQREYLPLVRALAIPSVRAAHTLSQPTEVEGAEAATSETETKS